MKIASLLPSATEIVYALGVGDDLIGVTDECDYPPDATTKPVISWSGLPQDRPLGPRGVDTAVRERLADGEPLYVLDRELLAREKPDVILTQDLCRVCAVPSGQVERALAEIGLPHAEVLSLDPKTLDEVIEQIAVVGKVLGRDEVAREVVGSLRERVDGVRRTATRLPSVRVLALEWSDPPFVAGHWIPEMVEAVGAVNLLSDVEQPSHEVTWREIGDALPEVVVFMPCGYYLEEAQDEAPGLFAHPDFADTPAARGGNVFAVDATSYFSRPGPRIVDGLEILAWAAHPETYPRPPHGSIAPIER
jgi:iron complex transport system substrate-binding protein